MNKSIIIVFAALLFGAIVAHGKDPDVAGRFIGNSNEAEGVLIVEFDRPNAVRPRDVLTVYRGPAWICEVMVLHVMGRMSFVAPLKSPKEAFPQRGDRYVLTRHPAVPTGAATASSSNGQGIPPGFYYVTYRAGGSGVSGFVAQIWLADGSYYPRATLPWERSFVARKGDSVLVAVTLRNDIKATVTAEILVNGNVWKSARSGESYNAEAQCGGKL